MAKYGQTANGMAHFAPMMRLEAPQINIRNPFNDLIAIAMKEREMELKEKGLGLEEQKLAYLAANDEENRQHARALAELGIKGARDNINLRHQLATKQVNRVEAKEKLDNAKVEEIRKHIGQIHNDVLKSGQNISRLEFAKSLEDYLRANTDYENRYIDKAMGLEIGSGNFRNTQSGNKGYSIGNRIIDLQ